MIKLLQIEGASEQGKLCARMRNKGRKGAKNNTNFKNKLTQIKHQTKTQQLKRGT